MKQVACIFGFTAFIHSGHRVEFNVADRIFIIPVEGRTRTCIVDRFG